LAADNPAYLPDLAMALNNLGNHYSELGRHHDALPPTEEATDTYRDLAVHNPAYLPNLAGALNNLCNQRRLLRSETEFEATWNACIQALDPIGGIHLRVRRSGAAAAGDVNAARWLSTAMNEAGREGAAMLRAIHTEARRHRAANQEGFERAWIDAGQPELPPWLVVDLNLLEVAESWLSTETYTAERDWLSNHPELLDPDSDAAVEEALLNVDMTAADRYREMRDAAQASGVENAYRPTLTRALVATFVNADPGDKRTLLAERADELLSDDVAVLLAEAENDDITVKVARCLIDLSRSDHHLPVLDAMELPVSFADVLADLATGADMSPLVNAAMIGALTTYDVGRAASARFYLAIAATRSGDVETATEFVEEATKFDAGQLTPWINEVARISAHHPDCLQLIPILTAVNSTQGAS
jgi:tetratricopeptide (TPR) repeat protein